MTCQPQKEQELSKAAPRLDTEEETMQSRKSENQMEHRTTSWEAPRGSVKEEKRAAPGQGFQEWGQLLKTLSKFYQRVECHSNFTSDFSACFSAVLLLGLRGPLLATACDRVNGRCLLQATLAGWSA